MRASVTVGVLGGMGPAATLDFFDRVLRATNASKDQEHLRLIIDCNPAVPDRNEAIGGKGPSSGPVLAEMARGLARAGANVIVMPCNAAHAFSEDITSATSIPFIDMIRETAASLIQRYPRIQRLGLLAANGCINAGLYPRAFGDRGVEVITPSRADQDALMALLYCIKAGKVHDRIHLDMRKIAATLVADGAQVLIAACTEVPFVLGQKDVPVPIVISTDVLVERTIAYARGTWSPPSTANHRLQTNWNRYDRS